MKIKILFLTGILLIIFSAFNIKESFSSDKALYYDAKTKKIIYYNVNRTDIFDEFKNVIPGDIKEQILNIKVVNSNDDVNMYMKIDFEENKDINNNIKIKLYKNDIKIIESNDMFKVINGMEDNIQLKMVMEVPTTVGNEIINYNNDFMMSFLVEDNNDLVEVPKTYENNIIIYYILLIISLILLILAIISLRKDNKKS